MNMVDVIQIMENRASTLNTLKNNAYGVGDLAQYAQLEVELIETQKTVEQLKLAQTVSQQVQE